MMDDLFGILVLFDRLRFYCVSLTLQMEKKSWSNYFIYINIVRPFSNQLQ